jgi:hypothetical protein
MSASVVPIRPIPEDRDPLIDHHVLALHGRLITADEVKLIPPAPAVVAGVLLQSSLALLWGPPGCGKSFVALDMAACIASGRAWHGRRVDFAPVLYIAAEGIGGLGPRVDAWQTANDTDQLPELTFLRGAVSMTDAMWRAALVEVVAKVSPTLIVVDTMARSIPGADENMAKDMGMVVAATDELRQVCDSAVLLVHHARKDGAALRGSTALLGAAETSIECSSEGQMVTLRCEKEKDTEPFSAIRLWREPVGQSCALVDPPLGGSGSVTDGQLAILMALADIDMGEGVSVDRHGIPWRCRQVIPSPGLRFMSTR